ncbi:MAG: hypothetical protein ACRD0B_07650, partial [Acidimicrobiales bacterium]
MRFVDDREVKGLRRRAFLVSGASGDVPGVLWSPLAGAVPMPLVLVGHGASGNKDQDYVVNLSRRLTARHGLAAAAIDGPVHGDRRPADSRDGRLQFLDFARAWSSDPGLTDAMVEDWRRTLDELLDLGELSGAVGYWGLSMGTI